ncbi:restriction endonuclease subunit S [Myroides sp. DF42-4-2]|uniref:restriction endonuclease subunit S n=1 Tax=Myroides sp. DF42-4-2 TaxID=2746726 RepID=UPI00257611B6|nr:restriction endonuclease subunit S [Myroides sp. DF42-4-2]MDM1408231.1 restriction endonuclease subunit S [Myroides sp. DF42-4-2]
MVERFKKSKFEWFDEIPLSWSESKISYLFEIGRGRVISQQELKEDGMYPVYSSQTKDNGCMGMIDTYDFDDNLITWTTDGANAGTIFIREGKFNCTNVCGTLKPILDIELKYYYYYLQFVTQFYKRPDTNGAKIMNNEMANIHTLIPPKETQIHIAKFLDKKTAEIDAIIEKKENLLLLLEEKKKAIINEAVTKGINPNAPMKDSGIEWIGEIPEHWEVKPLGYLGSCQNGVSKGGDYFGEGHPFVNYGDIYKNYELPTTVEGLAKSSEEDREAYSVLYGDVFFTRTSETIEEIGIASTCLKTIENAVFSGFTIRFRPYSLEELYPEYSKYFFRSNYIRVSLVKEMNLVTRASLSQTLLKSLKVILPPYEEQKSIVLYFQNKFQTIDKAKEKIDVQINKLKEYRQSLISEAVTGKIDI